MLVLSFLWGATPVVADTTGYGILTTPLYGAPGYGGPISQPGVISINKMVLDPRSDENRTKGGQINEVFVENIGRNDNLYRANETTAFKLIVTNTGVKTLTNIQVRDFFPQYIMYVSGNGGSFRNNTYTFTINQLEPGQSKEIILRGRVVDNSQLPTDQNPICIINRAEAESEDGKIAQDNAQLCIERPSITKGGQPIYPLPQVKETPQTGAEIFALIGILPGVLSGFILRKKAIKS